MPGLAPGIHVFAAPNLVEDVTSDFLQWFFVLDNENYRPAFQFPSARPQTEPVPPPNAREGEMFKSEHNGSGLISQLFKSQLGNLRRVFNPQPANRNDLLGDKLRDGVAAIL